MKKLIIILLILFSHIVLAQYQSPHFIRSPRGLLMGDAYTAVNNDEFALFYNPASLSRHRSDLTLYMLPGQLSGNNLIKDYDKFKDFPQTTTGVADLMMNYPVHASAGTAPGFRLYNFGFSIITQDSLDMIIRNKTNPMLDLDYHSDRGFAIGYSHVLSGSSEGKKKKSSKSKKGGGSSSQTSVGFGFKYVKRKGLRDTLYLAGADAMTAINNSDKPEEIMTQLGSTEGQAWGYDFGIEHVVRGPGTEFVFGISAMDILDTKFKEPADANGKEVADIKGHVNTGAALTLDAKLIHVTFSADVRNLTEQVDPLMRTRFGVELGLPGLSVMAGANSGYLSYGAMLNLGIVKVLGGFYDVEMGQHTNEIRNKRFVIYINLFSFSFDA